MKKYGWSLFFLLLAIGTGVRAYFMNQNEIMKENAPGSIKFAIGIAITFLIIAIERTGLFKEKKHPDN